jgi:hypothetical protein
MPIIGGDIGIKSWSFEILVVDDGHGGSTERCEDCVTKQGHDPKEYGTPIFADSECDSAPVCDTCGYVSYIFSPTSYCIGGWIENLEEYIVDPNKVGYHNVDYLDTIADRMRLMNLDSRDDVILELFNTLRANERRL